ncbi:protein phosphatase 1 regulatory subunit 15A [Ctenodactylus gundi]
MAPGQVPDPMAPWRDTHSFYLLSPLLGFLSRAWSRLRGPGPPEPWLLEAPVAAGGAEVGLEGDAGARLAAPHPHQGRHPEEEAREAALGNCLGLKANSSPPETWGLSDGDKKEAQRIPRDPERELSDGEPVPLSPSLLLRPLHGPDKSPGEEAVEGVARFSYPPSPLKGGPAQREERVRETVNKEAPEVSASLVVLGSQSSRWVFCSGEEKDQATEEKVLENKEARETSIFPSTPGSGPWTWKPWLEEVPLVKGDQALEVVEREDDPYPCFSTATQKPLLRAWEHQPGRNREEEESDSESAEDQGEAEAPSCIPSANALVRAFRHWPGEDPEEEGDSGSPEEERKAPASCGSPTSASAFSKTWVHRPGADTDEDEEEEDSDSGSAEDLGEAEAPLCIPPTASALLRAWVYQPGEDTEEEEEEGEDELWSSTRSTSTFLRAWVYQPGEEEEEEEEEAEEEGGDFEAAGRGEAAQRGRSPSREETQEEEDAEEGEGAEPRPFLVAIYVPGETPPAPWAAPKLPVRLHRRLRLPEAAAQDPNPKTPLQARKVRFCDKVTVHLLAVWAGPAQAARRGPWEQLARDRCRFARRIARAQEELGPCLTPASRARAWARLGNRPAPLAAPPPPPQTCLPAEAPLPAPGQATPPRPAAATPLPTPAAEAPPPSLHLSGRRG